MLNSNYAPCYFSVAMVGPSVTTYTGNNMGYRIYTIDGNHAETTNVSQCMWLTECVNKHVKQCLQ